MNKETKNAIYTGIAFVALAILISIWFGFFNKGKDFAKASGDKISTIQTQTEKIEFTDFDKTTVVGGDVIRAIRLYASEEFSIKVTTGLGGDKTYNTPTYGVSSVKEKDYIEPTGEFNSVLVPNANGTIVGITFSQEAVVEVK